MAVTTSKIRAGYIDPNTGQPGPVADLADIAGAVVYGISMSGDLSVRLADGTDATVSLTDILGGLASRSMVRTVHADTVSIGAADEFVDAGFDWPEGVPFLLVQWNPGGRYQHRSFTIVYNPRVGRYPGDATGLTAAAVGDTPAQANSTGFAVPFAIEASGRTIQAAQVSFGITAANRALVACSDDTLDPTPLVVLAIVPSTGGGAGGGSALSYAVYPITTGTAVADEGDTPATISYDAATRVVGDGIERAAGNAGLTLAAGTYELFLKAALGRTSDAASAGRANLRVLIEDVSDGADLDDQTSIGYLRSLGPDIEGVLSQHIITLAAGATIRIGLAEADSEAGAAFMTDTGGTVTVIRRATASTGGGEVTARSVLDVIRTPRDATDRGGWVIVHPTDENRFDLVDSVPYHHSTVANAAELTAALNSQATDNRILFLVVSADFVDADGGNRRAGQLYIAGPRTRATTLLYEAPNAQDIAGALLATLDAFTYDPATDTLRFAPTGLLRRSWFPGTEGSPSPTIERKDLFDNIIGRNQIEANSIEQGHLRDEVVGLLELVAAVRSMVEAGAAAAAAGSPWRTAVVPNRVPENALRVLTAEAPGPASTHVWSFEPGVQRIADGDGHIRYAGVLLAGAVSGVPAMGTNLSDIFAADGISGMWSREPSTGDVSTQDDSFELKIRVPEALISAAEVAALGSTLTIAATIQLPDGPGPIVAVASGIDTADGHHVITLGSTTPSGTRINFLQSVFLAHTGPSLRELTVSLSKGGQYLHDNAGTIEFSGAQITYPPGLYRGLADGRMEEVEVVTVAEAARIPKAPNTIQAPVDGADNAGMRSVVLPANYTDHGYLTLAAWDDSEDDIVVKTIPTAVIAAQSTGKVFNIGRSSSGGQSVQATWTLNTRTMRSSRDNGFFIYAQLHD